MFVDFGHPTYFWKILNKQNLIFVYYFLIQKVIKNSGTQLPVLKISTHLLLPRSTPVHGSINGEKDNSSQALHDTQRVRCTEGLFGGLTITDSPPVDLVDKKGDAKKAEIVSRTHTRSRAEEQLGSLFGVTRPTPLVPAQTIRNPDVTLDEVIITT